MGLSLRRLGVIAVVSALVGTLLDRIHTFFGVLKFSHPCFCEESCLVPFIMMGAGVALVLTHGLYRTAFRQSSVGTLRALVLDSVLFVTAYLASGIFKDYPLTLLVGYTFVAAIRVVQDPRAATVATVLTAMGVGTLAELFLTHVEFFVYLHPNICGLPYWIGGLYWFAGFAGAAVENRWPVLQSPFRTPLNS